jgi:hypothetical protein
MASASTEDGSYTQLGIMGQIWVTFGQGTGATRISQRAVMALYNRYFEYIASCGGPDIWEGHAMQVLERIRTMGRFAALIALQRGDTTISERDVKDAIEAVERDSDTSICPPKAQ